MKRTMWAIALMSAMGCGQEGPQGPMGPMGEPGMPGEPGGTEANVAAVSPTTAFLGRQITVQISGNNTHFSEKTRVEFGDANIRVGKITVGSPTQLTAVVTVGPADPTNPGAYAKLGPHDITVTSDHDGQDEAVTLKGQFSVSSPVRFVTLNPEGMPGGKLQQGGIGSFRVTNLDYVQNPFGAANTLGLSFLGDGAGQTLSANTNTIQARAFINVKAQQNPLFFAFGPAPVGGDVAYPLPSGVAMVSPTVEQRTPAELMFGMKADGKIMAKAETSLYTFKASMENMMKDRVYSVTITQDPMAKIKPVTALLPDSGAWVDQLTAVGGQQVAGPAGTPYFSVVGKDVKELYAIIFDSSLGGGEGYEFGVTVKEREASIVAMYMPGMARDMPNTQVDLSKATYIKDGKLNNHSEKNYFQFTASKDETIYVLTAATAPTDEMDNTVEVLEGTCLAGSSITGGPVDDDYYDSVSFEAKNGSTYCVIVGDSDFPFYAQMGGPYTLLVTSN